MHWKSIFHSPSTLLASFDLFVKLGVGKCAEGTKTLTFAHPKEPHAQEAGTAVCRPPSIYVKLGDSILHDCTSTTTTITIIPSLYHNNYSTSSL